MFAFILSDVIILCFILIGNLQIFKESVNSVRLSTVCCQLKATNRIQDHVVDFNHDPCRI